MSDRFKRNNGEKLNKNHVKSIREGSSFELTGRPAEKSQQGPFWDTRLRVATKSFAVVPQNDTCMGRTCVRSAHFAFQGVYGTMVDRLECGRRMSCVHVVFGRHLTGTAPKQALEAVLVVCSGFGRAQ